MRIVLLMALILIAYSCKETTSEFDNLPQADQDYLRNLSTAQCTGKFRATYDTFLDTSAKVFTTNSSFARANATSTNGFQQVFKNATNTKTVDVRVWKRSADAIYFYITEEGESINQYFLRITPAENEEMINDLLADHCFKPIIFTVTTGTSGPATLTYEYNKSVAPNTKKYKDVYTYYFNYPAYFANYKIDRTVTTVDAANTQVGEVVTTTSTLAAKSYTFVSDSATNAAYTQSFCEIDFETGSTYRVGQNSTATPIGYKLKTCVTTPNGPSGDWNLTI